MFYRDIYYFTSLQALSQPHQADLNILSGTLRAGRRSLNTSISFTVRLLIHKQNHLRHEVILMAQIMLHK